MLLDLDQGSMTVYKNDKRLGVMATGLSGEYCWAVSLLDEDDSAHIEAAATTGCLPLPPATPRNGVRTAAQTPLPHAPGARTT